MGGVLGKGLRIGTDGNPADGGRGCSAGIGVADADGGKTLGVGVAQGFGQPGSRL